ncbi:PREDICTED: receptor-like protein 12 isoform X2 [Camelina sativa]|uniref:Receptor-like protein 12 isoform X2 n=1 Tax=Camelina sativa TaxID=90675 RepID=A0ABM0YFV7_CAMSA|nr:PREDICTED: receptor-like protein 12 isoform X2 [Camelina sativa]
MKAFLSNQRMSFLLRSICFLFLVSSILNTFVSSTQHLCHSEQRDALLEFKSEFSIQEPDYSYGSSYPKTESWVNTSDCCSWDGITCAAKSGKVIGLDLSDSFLHGPLKSNSSLFRLRHLRHLNLAGNNFNNSQIPIKLLQLTKLVSLDLSSSRDFSSLSIDGSFLHLLAQNLRNLRELDMSNVNISSEVPQQFSNMRFLRSLHFTNCSLFGEFPSSVLLIPSLQSIRLSDNINLRGNLPVFSENNSLVELTIINTTFSGLIPDSISSLKHLTSLILSLSKFSGKIPFSLGNLSHLSHLDLSSNSFVGELPSSIGNLQQLTDFEVSANKLSGNLPASILNLTQLRTLSLSSNQFTGSLPPIISQFSKLESFYADDNPFTGAVLSSLVQIPSLTTIRLSYNEFDDFTGIGNISLLPNLEDFYVGSKNYNKVVDPGVVDLNVFSPLKKLEMLSLSGIPLSTANITSDSVFSSNLAYLDLPGCNITEFPEFIRNGRYLEHLDLSNNKIKGQVPDWLWRLPMLSNVNLSNNSLSGFNGSSKVSPESQITMVDLSSNDFQGPLFIPPSKHLNYFSGSKNNFTGEIPRSVCGLSSLEILYLSNNNLNGSIPWCLETLVMSSLSDLNLPNNRLSGILPEMFQNAKSLITLDVSHNRLEGKIPASLGGCSALEVLNVGSNTFNDMFPFHLNSLQKLQVLVLRSNKFHGTLHNADGVWFGFPQLKIIDVSYNDFFGTLPSDYFLNWTAMSSKSDDNIEPEYIRSGSRSYYFSLVLMIKGVSMEMERIHTIFTAIDFSGNQLHGTIPDSIGLLKELRILNLSSNAFTGHIPSSLANLTNLESLDLSQNMISGESQICGLSSLEVLDLSDNNLQGSIPRCLETLMRSLSYLNLRNNRLNGILPEIFHNAKSLTSIDISHNRLEGKIPASLVGCSALEVLNVASNTINDIFPFHLSSLQKLQVLVIRSNKFHGTLHNADGVWFGFPQLKIIDVSYNDFFGTLPSDYFLNWTAMSSMRDNNIEPEYIRSGSGSYYFSLVLMIKGVSMEMERILTIFTAIDFSGNQLHGTIPDSVGLLKELRILNMSSNDFTGHIPSSLANLTNLESLDLSQNNISGNPGLDGPSLKDVCGDIKTPPQPELVETKEEEEEEESLSWVAAGLGFGPGVVFGLAMGYITTSYKHEWFMKIFGRTKQQSTRTCQVTHQ